MITLKSTGIVRKVDELGRIVLPIELRRTLDIAEKRLPGDLYGWTVHHSEKNISPPAFSVMTPGMSSFSAAEYLPQVHQGTPGVRTVLI